MLLILPSRVHNSQVLSLVSYAYVWRLQCSTRALIDILTANRLLMKTLCLDDTSPQPPRIFMNPAGKSKYKLDNKMIHLYTQGFQNCPQTYSETPTNGFFIDIVFIMSIYLRR